MELVQLFTLGTATSSQVGLSLDKSVQFWEPRWQ